MIQEKGKSTRRKRSNKDIVVYVVKCPYCDYEQQTLFLKNSECVACKKRFNLEELEGGYIRLNGC